MPNDKVDKEAPPVETVPEAEPVQEEFAKSSDDSPSKHTVKELVEYSDRFSDYPSHFAAGALAHAGKGEDDLVSREEFILACKEFEKVEAF